MATIWSAPNYCHRYENLASILELDEQLGECFNMFEDAPENTRDKKVEKERDIHNFSEGSTRSSFGSGQGSSGESHGRNGRQIFIKSRREDFFI